MNNKAFINEVETRLEAVFAAYQGNKDVPPATLFRLEGFIQAGCALGLMTIAEANRLIAKQWQQHIQRPLPALSTTEVMIPTAMQRAPVYPSTSS